MTDWVAKNELKEFYSAFEFPKMFFTQHEGQSRATKIHGSFNE